MTLMTGRALCLDDFDTRNELVDMKPRVPCYVVETTFPRLECKSIGSFSGAYPFSSEKLQSLRRRKSTPSPRFVIPGFELDFPKMSIPMSICLENEPSLSVYKEKRSVSWSQTPCLVLATAGQSPDQKADWWSAVDSGQLVFSLV
ncbi:hypothetical protein D5086_000478 [Populus alba]|uniref:Uncharacterized protein n=1 Tax=Populus alba TaxID=43335 RepID=A0ACC4CVZ9_POPAL